MRFLLVAGLLLTSGCDEPPTPTRPQGDDPRVDALEARLEQTEARVGALEKQLQEFEIPLSAPELSVVLPTPEQPSSGRVSITVKPAQTFVDGEAVAQVALRAHLEAVLAKNPEASVVIQADATVDHQRVVETMKVIKDAGFERIAIATRSDD